MVNSPDKAKENPAAGQPAAGHGFRLDTTSVILLLLLTVLWGIGPGFTKVAIAEIPPLTVAAGRVGIAALVLLALLRLKGGRLPRSPRLWRWFLLTASTGMVIPFALLAWGQTRVDSAIAAIGLASVPLFTLPLAHVFTRDEKLTVRRLTGVIIGFLGIILLFAGQIRPGSGAGIALGVAAVILAAFCFSVEGLVIRRIKDVDGLTITVGGLMIAGAIILPLSLAVDRPWQLAPSAMALCALLLLAVLSTAISTYLMILLIQRIGVTLTSLNNYSAPVVGVFCGVMFLDERLTGMMIVASVLILCGVAVTSWHPVTLKSQDREQSSGKP